MHPQFLIFIEYDLFFLCPCFLVVQYAVDGLRHPLYFDNFCLSSSILDFSNIFFILKAMAKKGKVHCDLVFPKMPEPFVSHVVFDLSDSLHLCLYVCYLSEVSLSRAFVYILSQL